MKRLNKFLKIAILGLLSLVAVDGTAQKKVTYEFTGRPKGLILKAKPLNLVAKGAIPAGVSVHSIEGFIYEDGNDNDFNDVQISGLAGTPLIPQYVVGPQTLASVNFKGFRYEISRVQWARAARYPLLTSKGETWANDWQKGAVGTWEFDTNQDAYQTGIAYIYFTQNFVKMPAEGYFNGLTALNVNCKSKQAGHGIAIDKFIISYYDPEIVFTGNTTSSNPFTVDDYETITVSLKTKAAGGHPGAFTNSMITEITSSNPAVATVTNVNPNDAGTTATVTFKGNGRTTITAKLYNEGEVVAQASYILKLGPQPDFEWVQVDETGDGNIDYTDIYCDYFDNDYTNPLHRYYKLNGGATEQYAQSDLGDTNSGLRLFAWAPRQNNNLYEYWYDPTADYLGTSQHGGTGITQLNTHADNNYTRAAMQRLQLKQFVPAYCDIKVVYNIKLTSEATHRKLLDNYPKHSLEFFRFDNDNVWPEIDAPFAKIQTNGSATASTGNGSIIENVTGSGNNGGIYVTGNGSTGTNKTITLTMQYENAGTSTENSSVGKTDVDNFGAFCADHTYNAMAGLQGNGSTLTASYDYTSRTATYTYYRYIDFQPNGGEGTAPDATHSHVGKDATTPLNANTFTRDGYEFKGWSTKPDGDVVYKDGAAISCYDADGECGAGPGLVLYAQWQKIASTVDPDDDDFDEEAMLVYAFMANGGTIKDVNDGNAEKEVIAGMFYYTQAAPASFTPATAGTNPGYDFNGYWDAPEGGTQLFNASGTRIADGDFFANGKWSTAENAIMYAQWIPAAGYDTMKRTLNLYATDANDGPLNWNPNSDVEVVTGSTQNNNLAGYIPVRTGYTFTGWYTAGGDMVYNQFGESSTLVGFVNDPDLGEIPEYKDVNETYFKDGKYQVTVGLDLYAHWIANDIVLTFNEGGKSADAATYQIGSATEQHFTAIPTYDEAEYNTVKIKRTLKEGMWNTVCFPFDVYKKQAEQLFDKVMLYSELDVKGGNATMRFTECTEGMIAGVPYFVKYKTSPTPSGDVYFDGDYIVFKETTVTKTPTDLTRGSVTMHGQFNTVLHIGDGAGWISTNDYLYLQDDKFYVSGGTYNGKTVWGNNQGFRCYFSQPKSAGVKTLSIDLEGYDGWSGEDAIEDINAEGVYSAGGDDIYDLSGRQLMGKPQRGLYIVNGRKYISK